MTKKTMIAFGPVPSRRLGRSIGINNIPPKICTYSCVYCQIGRTLKMTINRQKFYDPDEIIVEVKQKIENALLAGETIDYLTIVPDGEPTLDINLGILLDRLAILKIKTAVITNSSLIHLPEVQENLSKANWVSVKIDAINEDIWRKIDRPHKQLNLNAILNGIVSFSKNFQGKLVTETMLVQDINDSVENIAEVAQFIQKINADVSYIGIPTRPPAEKWVLPPDLPEINRAFQIFSKYLPQVEYLIGYEGNQFAFTGNVEKDILSITSVHPMRADAVKEFVKKADGNFEKINQLVKEKRLIITEYNGNRYYLRNLSLQIKDPQ